MAIFRFFSKVSSGSHAKRRAIYGVIACITILLTIVLFKVEFEPHKTGSLTPISIAVSVPLSGKESDAGKEIFQSIQLYIDEINQKGGVNEHPLKLLKLDDQGTANGYKSVASEVIKSPAVLSLGNKSSELALGISQVYQTNRMPLISTFTLDELTIKNPYYFRTVPMASTQMQVLTLYIKKVLNFNTASIIQSQGKSYDKQVSKAFTTFFTADGGTVKHVWEVNLNSRKQSLEEIVRELATDSDAEPILLTTREEDEAENIIVAIRRAGIKAPIIAGSQTIGREAFARRFSKYDEEKKDTGFFTNGMYSVSPVLLDSAGADAQEFASKYQKLYGKLPSYSGVKFYEAAVIAVQALRNADLQLTPTSRSRDREQVRNALAAINSRKVSVIGLTGPLYFNASRSSDLPVRVAQFQNRQSLSAPEQFETVFNLEQVNVPQELKAGTLVQVGDDYFWRQNVVYTGIDLNQISQVDQRKSSFTADFYLWFRYPNGADATNVKFPGGTNLVPSQPLFNPDAPLEKGTIDGLNYRLYQIRGEFKTPFNLRDYPFDQQALVVRFQNTTTPSDRLIYVIDTLGLKLPQINTDAEKKPYQSLQLWKFKKLQYAQEVFRTTSTEGDPRLFSTNNRLDYSGLSATVTLQRRSLVFLVKNLLPLFVLMLVPMATLYFPERISKDRPPVTVAALISGTVLLVGVNNQLPEVGYTVALEYFFYFFFGLSLFAISVAIIADRLKLKGHKLIAERIDLATRIIYVLIIVMTVFVYWLAFRERI